MIGTEATKAAKALCSCATLTFVMVGFHIHADLLARKDGVKVHLSA